MSQYKGEDKTMMFKKWQGKSAMSIISRCGYGSATNELMQKECKHYPKKYRKKIYAIAKVLRNSYKRKGIMTAKDVK